MGCDVPFTWRNGEALYGRPQNSRPRDARLASEGIARVGFSLSTLGIGMPMNRIRLMTWTGALACAAIAPSPAGAQLSEAAGVRAAVPFGVGPFDLRVGGSVHRVGSEVGVRTPFTFESTLGWRHRSGGFWIGTGAETATRVDTQPVRPLLRYGAWQSFRRIQIGIGATTRGARLGGRPASVRTVTYYDSLFTDTGLVFVQRQRTTGDSGSPARAAHWSDIEGRAAWHISSVAMEATVGARPRVESFSPAVWGRIGATYPVTSRFSLAGAVGIEPARFALGIPTSTFLSVALRVRPWRSTSASDAALQTAFVVQRASDSTHRVVMTMPSASSVELSGDFDGWRPTSLVETRTGVWETTLALKPGTYHVNVRVNGGRWLPPPGLPQAEDDFNGAVGVLVVR